MKTIHSNEKNNIMRLHFLPAIGTVLGLRLMRAMVMLAILTVCGSAVELTPAAVADTKGDGPDGKGNTADDTWQFWFQLVRSQQYRRLDLATAALPEAQRKAGIRDESAKRGKQKVMGPIGATCPIPPTLRDGFFTPIGMDASRECGGTRRRTM